MWKPTTRGIQKSQTECAYTGCAHINEITDFYVVDFLSIHYFCEKHWGYINKLFKLIAVCLECKRSHKAEFFKNEQNIDMVKFQSKWIELCETHSKIFNRLVPTIELQPDYD